MKNEQVESDGEITLYPIECNPRAHTATVLFNGCPEIAQAYLQVLAEDADKPNGHTSANGHSKAAPFYPEDPAQYYWFPHDLVTLLLLPALAALLGMMSVVGLEQSSEPRPSLTTSAGVLLDHLILWKDGSFSLDDPLPSWWLYQVYWPGQFVKSLMTGKKWSRINVSTTKMFGLE